MPKVNAIRHENTVPDLFTEEDLQEDGNNSYNPKIMSYIRDDWIRKQMIAREVDFTEYHPLDVFVGSWNVNGKKPIEDISDWLSNGTKICDKDLYVVCFQEMVDLSTTNVLLDGQSAKRAQIWEELISSTLNSKLVGKYELIMSKHLVGILLCVFSRNDLSPHIHDLQGSIAATGIMGVMGNKGGAGIRFRFFDSSLCFVACHLAAHRGNVAGRNSDFHTILEKMEFRGDRAGVAGGSEDESIGILDHDFVIWAGDLNYRIRADISIDTVFDKIESGEIDWLAEHDQLNISRKQKLAFEGFEEQTLSFYPTYKYQAGTHEYDRRPEKKQRAPAWCDRILWRTSGSAEASHVKLESYGRSELRCSDHKPVQATMSLAIRTTVVEKRKAVYQQIMRKLDSWENSNLPKVEILEPYVDFPDSKFKIMETKSIIIKNVGKYTAAQFRFVPKLEDKTFCRSWLKVSPVYGMIMPGESMAISISTNIGIIDAHALSTGKEKIEDILILRIEKGRDFFVTVTGTYAKSCFASTVDELVRYSSPVRFSDFPKPSDPVVLNLPKEIWRLVDHIYNHGLGTKSLFGYPGVNTEIILIRESLDTGEEIPSGVNIHSVAQCLLSLLESLRESVVPGDLFPRMNPLDATRLPTCSSNILEKLPLPNHNVFVYVVCFLRELLKRENNDASAEFLADIFGRILFRPELAAAMDKPRVRASVPYLLNAATMIMYLITSTELS